MDPRLLPVIAPQPGQVAAGLVVSHWRQAPDELYLAVVNAGRLCSYRIDPAVHLEPLHRVELRTVILEKQGTPAWEVYLRRAGAEPRLLPGQHAVARTLPAEQWLHDIQTRILPGLVAQSEHARADRLAKQEMRRAINPADHAELSYFTARAKAQEELLGREYVRLCRATDAAALRCARTSAALHQYRQARKSQATPVPVTWNWLRRWRIGRRLSAHLKAAQAWHQRTESQLRQLERAAMTMEILGRIEQRARELIQADRANREQLAVLQHVEQRASMKLAEAHQLVHYLQRHQGSAVTLHESAVKGRANELPTIPVDAGCRVNPSAQTPSSVPSLSADTAPRPDPPRASQHSPPNVAVPDAPATSVKHPMPDPRHKSKGVRFRM